MAQVINTFTYHVDLPYLQRLTDKTYSRPNPNGCVFFAPMGSRSPFCDRVHPTGPGRLQHATCKSRFDLFIPLNWNRFPFIMLVTRGRHDHPPPPPSRLPQSIADDIIQLLRKEDCLSLTARKYTLSICLLYY
jgi:hypothetical protein